MDHVLKEMEAVLEPDDIRDLEEWIDGVSRVPEEWMHGIVAREKEISEEAHAALVQEAYKPKNRGWMNEMEIGQKGDVFAWVKKENLVAWKSSS
jgi:hypothetical protein